jgi:hypothetical protein
MARTTGGGTRFGGLSRVDRAVAQVDRAIAQADHAIAQTDRARTSIR